MAKNQNKIIEDLEAEIFVLKLDIQKDEKVMLGYDNTIKDLNERIEGYQKAMVDLDKKAYDRYKAQIEDLEKRITKLKGGNNGKKK